MTKQNDIITLNPIIMNSFIDTGFHLPTMTTVDDPSLKVIECDNGDSWTISFYVDNKIIDTINLQHPRGYKLDSDVMNLPVFNVENVCIGKVCDRLSRALTFIEGLEEAQLNAFEAQNC